MKAATGYPRFIIDKPEGKDLLDGSQDRIAENIIQFLKENDATKRKVIGIEGEWGSGKSNVIEILRKQLKDQYYFFVFDAWGHQEDLTRRSILEGLLINLIDDGVLNEKKQKWQNELKNLLAKKVEKETKSVPKFSWAVLLSLLGLLLYPGTKFLAETYLKAYTTATPPSNPGFLNYLAAFLITVSSFAFLVMWVLYKLYKAPEGGRKRVFEELLYVYKDKEIENTSTETISESEPTVLQFTTFLSKLEKDSKLKLVIVFDNMDRLPAAKVKEIWSSIHTFFASDDNGLNTWAIVPFDNEHICNIFIEDKSTDVNSDDRHRADSYIHKTFSIVFHVSPPILSAWKTFLSEKFKEAFGYTPPIEECVDTIFDYHHLSDPKIKPRDIICFINDLVALKKLWGDEIPLKYLAVFALKRTEIMENPFANIISRGYLGSALNSFFAKDINLETNISALAFNVQTDKADEILLRRTIESVLVGQGDLKQIYTHKSFFELFDSAFYVGLPDIIHVISCFNDLPEDFLSKEKMTNYWKKLAEYVSRINRFELSYTDAIKKVVKRLRNRDDRNTLLSFLFAQAVSRNESNNTNKFYYGHKYYELISEFESLLKEINHETPLTDLLPNNDVDAIEYFDFIKGASTNYRAYKVTCDSSKINDFLIANFDGNTVARFFPQLIEIKSTTDLSAFKAHVNSQIRDLEPTEDTYPQMIKDVCEIGKIISLDELFAFDIPENKALELLNSNPPSECTIYLLLSVIKFNISEPDVAHTHESQFTELVEDVEFTSAFIENYKWFFNYSDLIHYHLQYPSELTGNSIATLADSKEPIACTHLAMLLAKYPEIKEKAFINVISLCNSFIGRISQFYDKQENPIEITSDKLSYIIPLIEDNYSVESDLMKDLISSANRFMNSLDLDTWTNLFKDEELGENRLFKIMMNLKIYDRTTFIENANSAFSNLLIAISKKEADVPSDMEFWGMLFGMFDRNQTYAFKEVRDKLLVHTYGDVTMEEFEFFENGLFKFANLDENKTVADDSLRRILIPLASNDVKYIAVLKRNKGVIKKIIEKAEDSIFEFKTALEENCNDIFSDPEMESIVNAINEKTGLLAKLRNTLKPSDTNSP